MTDQPNESKGNVFDIRSKRPVTAETVMTKGDLYREVTAKCLELLYEYEERGAANEFITSLLPENARIPGADYVRDLNALSQIEQALDMRITIFSPGTTSANEHGWLINFHDHDEIFSIHAIENIEGYEITESYARAINLAIFVEFQKAKQIYNLN